MFHVKQERRQKDRAYRSKRRGLEVVGKKGLYRRKLPSRRREGEHGGAAEDRSGFRTRRQEAWKRSIDRTERRIQEPPGGLVPQGFRRGRYPLDSDGNGRETPPPFRGGRGQDAHAPRKTPLWPRALPSPGARPSWRRAGRLYRPAGFPTRTMSPRQRRQREGDPTAPVTTDSGFPVIPGGAYTLSSLFGGSVADLPKGGGEIFMASDVGLGGL